MAITSNYMGLRIWNSSADIYDHEQLADNWRKVDEHDHSGDRGKQIPTGGIEDGAVTADKIADGVVPSTFTLDDGSVTEPKLAANAVTAGKLADNSVDSAAIIDGTIQTADIGNSQVNTAKLATDSVDNTILKDDAVTDANRAVTSDHIRSGAVISDKLSDAIAEFTGISTGTGTRRGYFHDDAGGAETWAGTPGSYGHMPTPHRVQNIEIPSTGGIVYVIYRALWRLTGASNDGKITLFVGSQQLQSVMYNQASPSNLGENLDATGDNWSPVTTTPTRAGSGSGIFGSKPSTTTGSGLDNALPQAWGNEDTTRWAPIIFESPGGTYDISVRFQTNNTSGGTLEVKEPRLRVWVAGF